MSMSMLTVLQIMQALACRKFLYYLSCFFAPISSYFQFDYVVDWNTVSIFCPSMEKKEVCNRKISGRIFFSIFSAYFKRRNWSKNAVVDKLSQAV